MKHAHKIHLNKKPKILDTGEPTVPVNNYRLLFDSVPDPCLVLDPELEIVAVNDAFLRATLTKREEIIGCAISEVFPDNPGEANATGASLKRVLANRAAKEFPQIRQPLGKNLILSAPVSCRTRGSDISPRTTRNMRVRTVQGHLLPHVMPQPSVE